MVSIFTVSCFANIAQKLSFELTQSCAWGQLRINSVIKLSTFLYFSCYGHGNNVFTIVIMSSDCDTPQIIYTLSIVTVICLYCYCTFRHRSDNGIILQMQLKISKNVSFNISQSTPLYYRVYNKVMKFRV